MRPASVEEQNQRMTDLWRSRESEQQMSRSVTMFNPSQRICDQDRTDASAVWTGRPIERTTHTFKSGYRAVPRR